MRGAVFTLLVLIGAMAPAPALAQLFSGAAARDTSGAAIAAPDLFAGSHVDRRVAPMRFASPIVPIGHWAYGAVRRLEGLGLAPAGYGGATRTRTEREFVEIFEAAELVAEVQEPELAPLVRGYRIRFADEFPGTFILASRGASGVGFDLQGGRARVGYEMHRGGVGTGTGYDSETDWTGVTPRDERQESATTFTANAIFAPHLAFSVTPANHGGRWALDAAHLQLSGGAFGFWLGRRSVAFHAGVGGGIVIGEAQRYDGGGIFLDEPVELPWIFRYLGPMRFEMLLTRIENGDRITEPWFGAAYANFEPHPRFELGLSRGIIFGGKGNSPLTFKYLAQMITGFHAGEMGEYSNEVLSLHFRIRPNLGPVPVVFLLEWGMDDSAGGWSYVPGRVLGVEVPALPGLPQIAIGAERTTFAPACCGNTIWYRNWSLRGGWANDGNPLGHPLGGQGEEWLVYTRADLFEARVNLDLRYFARERGAENLYAPQRAGRSRGGRVSLEGRVVAGIDFFLNGIIEDGDAGWREEALAAGLQLVF